MDDVIVEIAGRRFHGSDSEDRWWIPRDGLDDWFDSPDNEYEETGVPGQDGAFEPTEVLVSARRVNLIARNSASTEGFAVREIRMWAAALAKSTDLGFRVHMDGQWLSLRNAKIRGRVRTRRLIDGVSEFAMTIWSADPRKYGIDRAFYVDAIETPAGGLRFPIVRGALAFGDSGAVSFPGAFQVHNPGTAEIYPTFRVRGPLSSLSITSESSAVEYAAPLLAGQTLTLTPYAGGRALLDGVDSSHNLLQASWVPVAAGETRGYLFTPATPGLGAQLEVSYPEGAWW